MSKLVHDTNLAHVFLEGVSPAIQGEACPSAQELWDALAPQGPADLSRYRVLNHCARCPACAQDLQITKILRHQEQRALDAQPRLQEEAWREASPRLSPAEFQAQAPANAQESRARRRTSSRASRWPRNTAWAIAAAAVAATLALIFLPKQRQSDVTYRGQAATAKPLGAQAKELLPQVPQSKSGYRYEKGTFHWPQLTPHAASYTITIVNAGFEELCSLGGIKETFVQIDAQRCPGLRAARPFYWKVRTLHKDGTHSESRFVSKTPAARD